ncbi:NAD(P)H-dependent oxidoreductase [Exilibacterium tricleocarpae]|uniref:NAD(P)H-dependent oxidoreductase n=1 Tax=Exilibacterium tricleocarpae TaxID=2591008 RepID=A0A545TZ45_9GAMM|nr:NAD(P)H-dependent oxidoreductase [Exilibacterium tricleocarpae]TQV82492.1 NAD(P)H-dependent oxidoreductase [Exilibacterium tricleocarpae]
MHALIVVANPNPKSLTHSVAEQIADGVSLKAQGNTTEIADLAAEKFDPFYTVEDICVLHGKADPSPEVLAEQQRISRANALVLVHPVYWWSFPALLKGWIDRVFTNGWAYDDTSSDRLIKKLQYLPVHIISIAGADMRTYARHGYYGAMKTQINHGIFNYCGAPVKTSELMFQADADTCLRKAHDIGLKIFTA